jgi:hypothetical protein
VGSKYSHLLVAGFLFDLLSGPEDGDDIFLHIFIPNYMPI